MTTEIVPAGTPLPAQIPTTSVELVAIQADVLLARRQAVEKVVHEVMVPGVHYGEIPGVKGKSLLKPGTEVLMASFNLAVSYEIQTLPDEEDGRRYVVEARVTHQPTGIYLGSGMGEASTNESKWKWRSAQGTEADDTPADRRRKKHRRDGGSFWQVRQEVADVANTVLKQACKRAAADAVLAVLGVRGVVLDAEPLDAQRGPQRSQQAPQRRSPKAAAGKVRELVELAAGKGFTEDDLLARFTARGYRGKSLDGITVDDLQWARQGLSELPDAEAVELDPVTGEVLNAVGDDAFEEAAAFFPGGEEG